jgi:ATP-dependent DNA helicase RecG
MEQMVLQYVKAHGRITRQDVLSLCRVNENQASYILKKLVKSGDLQLIGKGPTSAYASIKVEATRKISE